MRFDLKLSVLLFCLICLLLNHEVRADVVAVVSVKNPVAALNKNAVADIFLGRNTRFPDGARAVPIDQREGMPARDEFYMVYTGKSAAQIKSFWAKIIFTGRGQPPKSAASDAEIKTLLAQNPQLIAYLDRSAVDSTVKVIAQP